MKVEVEKVALFHIGHILQGDAIDLNSPRVQEVYHYTVLEKQEGFLVYITLDEESYQETFNNVCLEHGLFSEFFWNCLQHARANGCCWVLFDTAGPTYDDLDFFDW